MKSGKHVLASVTALAVLVSALLVGCAALAQDNAASQAVGSLVLSALPEIRIAYNGDGRVVALTGQNEDGIAIVEAYPDYIGKDCREVTNDIIVEMYKAGGFADDLDGNKRDIVLRVESGSSLPGDDFLQGVRDAAQNAVNNLGLSSGVVAIGSDDYDAAYARDGEPSPYITLEKAREIALAWANVRAEDAVFEEREFDHDDGVPVFELEFIANGNKYEYDIHAITGKVLQAEQEVSGLSDDYGDTDYGPYSDGVTDYGDTDYGPYSDGVTDYGNTNYGNSDYGSSNYGDAHDGGTSWGRGTGESESGFRV